GPLRRRRGQLRVRGVAASLAAVSRRSGFPARQRRRRFATGFGNPVKPHPSGWKVRPTIGDLSMNLHRWLILASLLGVVAVASSIPAACCYFAAKHADILQPAQKAFLTWDPDEKIETFTVQPKFEGNALDFGMVIPTPTQPKLHEMPRDFFKHLAIYSIMK